METEGFVFRVKSVPQKVMDNWPVDKTGLPTRVIRRALEEGITAVADMCSWYENDAQDCSQLGKKSMKAMQSFFELCRRIQKGELTFTSFEEYLQLFLVPEQVKVLNLRYGLDEATPRLTGHSNTLESIGRIIQRTRERVRQIEESALQQLSTAPAVCAIQPFVAFYVDLISRKDLSIQCSEIVNVDTLRKLGGLHPCSVLRLLILLHPRDEIHQRQNFFSLLPAPILNLLQREAMGILDNASQPLTAQTIQSRVTPDLPEKILRKAISCILRSKDDILETKDGRFFNPEGFKAFVVEVMNRESSPIHIKVLTATVNNQLEGRCKKGMGHLLQLLNAYPDFRRVAHGMYELCVAR